MWSRPQVAIYFCLNDTGAANPIQASAGRISEIIMATPSGFRRTSLVVSLE